MSVNTSLIMNYAIDESSGPLWDQVKGAPLSIVTKQIDRGVTETVVKPSAAYRICPVERRS